jgi:Protein of unknown function (DUF2852)
MTVVAAKLDEFGRPAWIAMMVLGFIVWWPVGLAVLGFLIFTGRMGRMGCRHGGWGRWHREGHHGWHGYHPRHLGRRDSGNSAFEEYKMETLKRLEEEQGEFQDFLQRLRHAKDKAEFDQFMTDRRNKPQTPPASEAPDVQPQ